MFFPRWWKRLTRVSPGFRHGQSPRRVCPQSFELRVEALEQRMLLSAGDLDNTFGLNGTTVSSFSVGNDTPSAMVLQPDGKAVVVGTVPGSTGSLTSSSSFAIARYNTNGALDTSFGTNGLVTVSMASFSNAFGVTMQSDGKIIVVGEASAGQRYDFAVVRLNTNGSLDTSFDSDGIVATIMGFGNSRAASVAVQLDGKIVVGGTDHSGTGNDFAIARYNTDGSLDTTFGVNGAIDVGIGSADDVGISLKLQIDQKILLAGNSTVNNVPSIAVFRFNTNGSLDTTWGGTGYVATLLGAGTTAAAVASLADGRVVVAGTATLGGVNNFAILRYNGDGSLDPGFNGGRGFATAAFGANQATAASLVVQNDYRVVVGGAVIVNGVQNVALARYDLDGTLDTYFGVNGLVITAIGSGNSFASAIRVQSDGNLVVAGPTANGLSGVDFMISRYVGPRPFQTGDPNTIERMYRAYNPNADYHFFTTSSGEFSNAVAHGYSDETTGKGGFSVRAGQYVGTSALYRLYNSNDGRHYYTLSAGERDALQRTGWNYEAIEGFMFSSATSGTVEIFHLYNNNSGSHLFTESVSVKNAVLNAFPGIWVQQRSLGFAYLVSPTSSSSVVSASEFLAEETMDGGTLTSDLLATGAATEATTGATTGSTPATGPGLGTTGLAIAVTPSTSSSSIGPENADAASSAEHAVGTAVGSASPGSSGPDLETPPPSSLDLVFASLTSN